jgi:hypothetical protein
VSAGRCGDCRNYEASPQKNRGACWAFAIQDTRFGPLPAAAFASESGECERFTPHATHCRARQRWGDGECECARPTP